MSCYTTLELDINFKSKLSAVELQNIEKKFEGDCGNDSYREINETKSKFKVWFNYGLKDKIVDLLNELEKYIQYDKLAKIGEFDTEEINVYRSCTVYAFKNRVFILQENNETGWGFDSCEYHFSDLRGNSKTYNEDVDKNSKIWGEKLTKKMIGKFIKNELKLQNVKE